MIQRAILTGVAVVLCNVVILFKANENRALPQTQARQQNVQSSETQSSAFDVIDYDADLRVNIADRSLAGTVLIQVASRLNGLREITLQGKEIVVEEISDVDSGAQLQYENQNGTVRVILSREMRAGERLNISVRYNTRPTRAVRFFADHFYAAYDTPRWLVCHFDPGDRATINLRLTIPAGMTAIANGEFIGRQALPGGESRFSWQQRAPIPPYTFGFAAGIFREVVRRRNGVALHYLTRDNFSLTEIERVFAHAPAILDFFEQRAGVRYPLLRYTQVLASGTVAQEMGGFTVMREDSGRRILDNPSDIYLMAHEFAHQWWGVGMPCADWANFWLNEGFAEFMAAAFREDRFGRVEYEGDMEEAREVYARIRAAGRDRPLAYRHSIGESQAGGGVVYNKGALILHLLRYEMGDARFWSGVRRYTRDNFGRGVTTQELLIAMERASGRTLTGFFEQWIYRAGIPEVTARHRIEGREIVIEFAQNPTSSWNFSVNVAVTTTSGRQSRRLNVSGARTEARFSFTGDLLSVRVDDGGNLPFRIPLERQLSMLLYQLMREPDVAGRADALANLKIMLAGNISETEREQIKAALRQSAASDASPFIRERAQQALN